MQAILLAGGKGTRLRPYTAVLPKPLMPIGELDPLPIMEVVLRQLARFGFRDVTVITGYLTELIEAFFGDGRKVGTRLTYCSARSARSARPGGLAMLDRPDEPVLVINGDILTTLDFAAMYAFHRDRGASATIASYPREVKIDFGVLDFGDDPHVLAGYREKPEFSFQVSMGLYILGPVAWDFLEAGRPLPMPDLLETMRRAGRPVHCYKEPCYWLDIGRHDDYATANEVFEARRRAFLGDPAAAAEVFSSATTPARRPATIARSARSGEGSRRHSDRTRSMIAALSSLAARPGRLPARVDPVRPADRPGVRQDRHPRPSARATSGRPTSAG